MPLEAFTPFVVRPLIALLTQTFFQPDEFYQALEPAHHAVFGYGQLTWEWLSDPPIRSIIYPTIWMPVYQALKMTGLDSGPLLILAPKALAGVLAGVTDIYVWKFASRWGKEYGRAALFFSLFSSFNALALSRTLSNSLETSLTIAALFYWPFPSDQADSRNLPLALGLAALSCLIRPTGAIIWVFLGLGILFSTSQKRPQGWFSYVMENIVGIGAMSLLTIFAIDTIYYEQPTFTPWNFLRVNASSVSSFYGSQAFHYYLSQALPVLCGTSLPWVLWGAWSTNTRVGKSPLRSITLVSLATIGVYSLSSHKEWRFIHPLLSMFHLIAARSAVDQYRRSSQAKHDKAAGKRKFLDVLPTCWLLQLLNIPIIIYVVFFHSSAQIAVMHYLRSMSTEELKSVGFLMPCHSTPMHAYIHRPEVEVWAIGCEPPLRGQNLMLYRDQTRVFFDDPITYVVQRFPLSVDPSFPPSPLPASKPGDSLTSDWKHTWPSHLAFFGALIEGNSTLQPILEKHGYQKTWFSGNGWEEDEKRRGGVQVWSWTSGQ
ncbi:glycosylphosphatidylinositol anchor biosynthesis [Tulasnella sp. 330]|nr:glycosylphosphatidylinositol anchor biosynthesis [Tulasnella sp. 330]KAG8885580.1 glycosylphosphatidylinositol anchor biosynthesis [Tulasnella sp. 331]KAG8889914.1 glycosylphosphatidylinositol anchor biosynthesis [Tulasnella sp. 332]